MLFSHIYYAVIDERVYPVSFLREQFDAKADTYSYFPCVQTLSERLNDIFKMKNPVEKVK